MFIITRLEQPEDIADGFEPNMQFRSRNDRIIRESIYEGNLPCLWCCSYVMSHILLSLNIRNLTNMPRNHTVRDRKIDDPTYEPTAHENTKIRQCIHHLNVLGKCSRTTSSLACLPVNTAERRSLKHFSPLKAKGRIHIY